MSYDHRAHFGEEEKEQLRKRIIDAGRTVHIGRVGVSNLSLDTSTTALQPTSSTAQQVVKPTAPTSKKWVLL